MKNPPESLYRLALAVVVGVVASPLALAGDEAFARCAQQFPADPQARLKCFDAALESRPVDPRPVSAEPAAASVFAPAASGVPSAPAQAQTDAEPPQPVAARAERSYLTRLWNLDNRPHRGLTTLDRLQPHRQSYLIVRETSNVNRSPATPSPGHAVAAPYSLDAMEAKFQLSFKSDIGTVEGLDLWGLKTLRVWGAYTQQSHWQVFNTRNSSPFRETNYQPELIASFGTGNESGWKLLNLGLEHQSNGRSLPDSRSWNRVYVQGGWEWGNTSLLARGWWRVPENIVKDDNPDIVHYIGRAEMTVRWEPDSKEQAVSLLLRNNLELGHNRGLMQLDWSAPVEIGHAARLHAQLTTGYGESLIDYNHRQTTFGVGVSFREW
ncbi:MAG: phospholipase A [Gallionella sp.]|nr:phospholipase A [Gallionella sp.]